MTFKSINKQQYDTFKSNLKVIVKLYIYMSILIVSIKKNGTTIIIFLKNCLSTKKIKTINANKLVAKKD